MWKRGTIETKAIYKVVKLRKKMLQDAKEEFFSLLKIKGIQNQPVILLDEFFENKSDAKIRKRRQ